MKPKKKKYWYLTTKTICWKCGAKVFRDKKERQYTPKPKRKKTTTKIENWRKCLECENLGPARDL